jgi:hypothetical protein
MQHNRAKQLLMMTTEEFREHSASFKQFLGLSFNKLTLKLGT